MDKNKGKMINKNIQLYSDGSCSGNPGPGGYGALLLSNGEEQQIFQQRFTLTTNNRMELLGIIEPLEEISKNILNKKDIEIYTDSQYVVNAINNHWLISWKKNKWIKINKKPVKNQDLWERLDSLLCIYNLTFHWIRGHNNNPHNERCNEIAVKESKKQNTHIDKGYKSNENV